MTTSTIENPTIRQRMQMLPLALGEKTLEGVLHERGLDDGLTAAERVVLATAVFELDDPPEESEVWKGGSEPSPLDLVRDGLLRARSHSPSADPHDLALDGVFHTLRKMREADLLPLPDLSQAD